MSQFDCYLNPLPNHKTQPYLVEIQHSSYKDLSTVTVIPLVPENMLHADQKDDVLMPLIELDGITYRLLTTTITTIRRDKLGRQVASLAAYRAAIIRAIDYFITWN